MSYTHLVFKIQTMALENKFVNVNSVSKGLFWMIFNHKRQHHQHFHHKLAIFRLWNAIQGSFHTQRELQFSWSHLETEKHCMTETVKRELMMITALRNTVVIINLTLTKSRSDIFSGHLFWRGNFGLSD